MTAKLAYSPGEVAEIAGISPAQFLVDIEMGVVKFRKCGTRHILLADDFQAYRAVVTERGH